MKNKNKQHSQNQLADQLDRLNQKLNTINFNKSRFFIYNANPAKFAFYNFIAGVFHSLGSLFGTLVIAAVIFYFISTIDFIKPVTDWIEEVGSQVNWQKIMPLPDPSSIDLNRLNLDEKLLR